MATINSIQIVTAADRTQTVTLAGLHLYHVVLVLGSDGSRVGLAYRDGCVDARTFKPRPFRTERGALAAAQKWLCERKTEVDYAMAIAGTEARLERLRLAACGVDTSEVDAGWLVG
jgi:hypothetical protein